MISGNDSQITYKSNVLKGLKCLLLRADPSAPFTFNGLVSRYPQGRGLAVFGQRYTLHISDDIRPIPTESQEAVKERIDVS